MSNLEDDSDDLELQCCFVVLLTLCVCVWQTCWATGFEGCRHRASCNSLQACGCVLGDAGFHCHQLTSSCVRASGCSSDISKIKCRDKKAFSRCRFLSSRESCDGSLVGRVEHASPASLLNSVITATMGAVK
eukprot:s1150_g10.t1